MTRSGTNYSYLYSNSLNSPLFRCATKSFAAEHRSILNVSVWPKERFPVVGGAFSPSIDAAALLGVPATPGWTERLEQRWTCVVQEKVEDDSFFLKESH